MALGWKGQYFRYKEFFLNISSFYKQRADLRAFLEIILSLGTIIVFLIFALKPTVLTILSLLQEIKNKQNTVAALTLKVKNLQLANDVFAQNQNTIPNIDIAIGTTPAPDIIMQQIQGLAVKNSVAILSASVSQVTIIGTTPTKKASSDVKPLPAGAKEMPISISVKGDYANILQYVKDFENLRVITKIDSTTINSSTTDNGQVIVAIINGRVPFVGQK